MTRISLIALSVAGSVAVAVGAAAQTLSPGAKVIYDEMMRDTTGARAACRGGSAGLQNFVGQVLGRVMMDSRKAATIDANRDLMPATEAFSKRCPQFMR
jgi:hypothetical protein